MKRIITVLIESNWFSLDIDELDSFSESLPLSPDILYITFQTSDLIRHFKSINRKRISKIIDLECYAKQMSQEGSEFHEYNKWKALSCLRHHKIINEDFRLTHSNIKIFLEYLRELFLKLSEVEEIEIERFENIELNINKLIYKRQSLGIRVDKEKIIERSIELEKSIYGIKNKLQLEYGIFSPDNTEEQRNYIKKKGFNFINTLLYTFKAHRKEDEVSNLFYLLIRNQQDLDSLLFIHSRWGGDEICYPTFFGFGTITSRITLREPSLQNLRKTNRDIIITDFGKKILYIDYSQFEAGILASLSQDSKLIELYNTDIYSDLAKSVFNDEELRKEAKIIFYRYMYGDKTLSQKVIHYFDKFHKLKGFKTNTESYLQKNNKIGGKYGNYRYAFDDNYNWALSHIVQSTASYIYKKALLRVYSECKNVDFLIPMHDGTVYQINESEYDELKAQVAEIYIEEFKIICPEIEPRLTMKDKFE